MMIDHILFAMENILFFNMFMIIIVDIITLKLISIVIINRTQLYLPGDVLIFVIRWSLIIGWGIILIYLNVVIFADTYNDIYVAVERDLIGSE